MKNIRKNPRRSGVKIMASLILLLGSLSYIMVLAIINGSLGFLCAMGVTFMGAVGIAGVDIDRIDSGSLLQNVTMVSQTTYLFDET